MFNNPTFKKQRNSKYEPTPHDELKQEVKTLCERFVRNRFKKVDYEQQKYEFLLDISRRFEGYYDIARFFVNREEAIRREPQPKVMKPRPRTTSRFRKRFEPYETNDVIDLENIKPGFD